MRRVTTIDFVSNFGKHRDHAMTEPVIVTKYGRDRLVLISIDRYEEMKRAYDAQCRKAGRRE